MLLLVTLKIITKSITTLIRGKGGKCVLTITMSELTGNIASVSSLFAIACRRFVPLTNRIRRAEKTIAILFQIRP